MQKLEDLLLNLVVVFEACRIKGLTPLWAAEAAKQLVIRGVDTFFLSFFVASHSGRVPLNSGMWLQLDEFSSEGLEFC